jgi:hypothetical protein
MNDEHFASELGEGGCGHDEHGTVMAQAYLANIKSIVERISHGDQRQDRG